MALVMAILSAELTGVFSSDNPSGAVAAQKIASAYDKYCKTAMASAATPLFTGLEAKALEGVIAGAMANNNGAAAIVANAIQLGVQSYWTAPPVQFVGTPMIGMVSAMLGVAAIGPALTEALSNNNNQPATIAQSIAEVLDAATKTVMVVFTAPPPPAGPPPPAMVL